MHSGSGVSEKHKRHTYCATFFDGNKTHSNDKHDDFIMNAPYIQHDS